MKIPKINIQGFFPEDIKLSSKITIITTFVFAIFLLFVVESVGLRMLQEKPISPLHQKMGDNAIKMTEKHSVKSVPKGTNPFLQPMGSRESLMAEYSDSEAFSIFTRHGVTGKNWKYRVLINMIHLFGAISTFVFLIIIYFTFGSKGNSKLNLWAKKTFFWTTYSMLISGTLLFLLQESGDLAYPSSFAKDISWVKYSVFFGFSLSFVNAACHANIFNFGSLRLLYLQHVISIVSCIPMMAILISRFFSLDYYSYQWMYNFELLILVSLYPVLDIINGSVLYKTQLLNKSYDWDAHRQDNIAIFTLLASTTVLYFASHDKHYFFSTHLIPAYRIAIALTPTFIWLVSGALKAWILRAYRA